MIEMTLQSHELCFFFFLQEPALPTFVVLLPLLQGTAMQVVFVLYFFSLDTRR